MGKYKSKSFRDLRDRIKKHPGYELKQEANLIVPDDKYFRCAYVNCIEIIKPNTGKKRIMDSMGRMYCNLQHMIDQENEERVPLLLGGIEIKLVSRSDETRSEIEFRRE